MSRNLWLCAAGLGLLGLGALPAQSRDAWLMQNYRFTGPPAPGSVQPSDPVLSEMWRIQNDMRFIMWRAKQDEDYPDALWALGQMSGNVQAIGAFMEHEDAVASAKRLAAQAQAQAKANAQPPLYLIAFKDHTIAAVTRYWTDGPILHYVTSDGTHVQKQLDSVDRTLSARLNRESHLEFHLPE